MREPNADELAAIAAAYAIVAARRAAIVREEASRWSLAGRLPSPDPQLIRVAARSASRWNAAARRDG